LYHYNHRCENWDLNTSSHNNNPGTSRDAQSRSIHNWGGPLTRRALQAINTLAFICLLRSDEVLKIRREHVELVKEDNNTEYMILTLPFRKTHQDGRTFSRFPLAFSNADGLSYTVRCSTVLHIPPRRGGGSFMPSSCHGAMD
jgi:hypothetical protein